MIGSTCILLPEEVLQTGEKPYLQNWDALKYYKELQDRYNAGIVSAGTVMLDGAATFPPAGIAGGAATLTMVEFSIRVERLVSTVEKLLKIDGIIVTPRVKTQEGTIDLLVRMPDRRAFIFALRSKKDSRVRWQEEKQDFLAITPRKGGTRVKKWSNLLKSGQDLNKMALSLKKEQSYLFGASGTERRAPITKAIVLTSKTIVDPNNDPALFVDFGQTKALRVHAGSYMYVVEQKNLLDFLAPVQK
jgi:hypothetical protein